jgi:hypothetical protein
MRLPPSEVTGGVAHARASAPIGPAPPTRDGHDATGQRKQILDAVVQLAQQQTLLLLRSPALGDVIFDAPMIFPSGFLTGDTVSEIFDGAPVLGLPNGFVMVDALAAANAGQDAGAPRRAVRLE